MVQNSAAADDARDPRVLRAAEGDPLAMGALFSAYRDRLKTVVGLRLDRRLRSRVDASDVLQEAFIEAARRIGDYARDERPMPLYLWLRFLTVQQLLIVHRRHLGTKMRDARGEVSLNHGGTASPEAPSATLAAQLLGQLTLPDEAAMKAEVRSRLQEAMERMDPIDREVLALRHFEMLTNGEAAEVLGIGKTAASNRYVRALTRLRELLNEMGISLG